MFKLLFILSLACLSQAVNQKPHIIQMVIDDLGWNDVSWHNPEQIITPKLANLIQNEGVVLTNYYTYRFCSPSRSQFMTGRYPWHLGQQTNMNLNPMPGVACGINLNYTFLPGMMKKANYSTHALGKWHQGYLTNEYTPTYRGFDTYVGYYSGAEEHFTHYKQGVGCPSGLSNKHYDLVNQTGPVIEPCWNHVGDPNNKTTSKFGNGTYSSYLFGNETIRIINDHQGEDPLYFYVAWDNVHDPCQAPSNYYDANSQVSNEGRRYFASMMSALDDSITNIVQALKDKGYWDNTILVVTTDNGGNLGGSGNNYPLRGGKYTFWEGGVKGIGAVVSPLIPTKIQGKPYDGLVSGVDWYSTFAHLAGVSDEDTGMISVDGKNVWEAIAGNNTSPRDHIIHQIWGDVGVIRKGDYKLCTGYPGWASRPAWDGWVQPADLYGVEPEAEYDILQAEFNFKGQANTFCKDTPCLFNIKEDPTEKNDIAANHTDIVNELLAIYNAEKQTEISIDESGICPTATGTKADPNCCIMANNTGFWLPWVNVSEIIDY